MKYLLAVACVAGTFLAGCASHTTIFKQPKMELEIKRSFDVEYKGGIGAQPINLDVESVLKAEATDELIYFETQILRIPTATALEIAGVDTSSIAAMAISTDQLRQFIEYAQSGNSRLISAPRVTAYEGQTASISIVDQTAFVSSFELVAVTPAMPGSETARVLDPVVDTIESGIMLTLKGQTNKTGIQLELAILMSELETPIQNTSVKVMGHDVMVQAPVLFSQKLSTRVQIVDGGSLLITGMVTSEQDEAVIILLTARKVEYDELATEEK